MNLPERASAPPRSSSSPDRERGGSAQLSLSVQDVAGDHGFCLLPLLSASAKPIPDDRLVPEERVLGPISVCGHPAVRVLPRRSLALRLEWPARAEGVHGGPTPRVRRGLEEQGGRGSAARDGYCRVNTSKETDCELRTRARGERVVDRRPLDRGAAPRPDRRAGRRWGGQQG